MRYFFFSNDGKLGDAVLHTALIDGIHQYDQDAHISVAASLQTVEFWKRDPRIEDVITLHKAWFWDYIAAGIQHRDIDWLIFFKKRRSEKDWLFQLFSRAKNVIVSPMVPNAHAIKRCDVAFQKIFKVQTTLKPHIKRRQYYVYPPHSLPTNYILLNCFGGGPRRSIGLERAVRLLQSLEQHTSYRYVLVGQQKQKATLDEMLGAVRDQERFKIIIADIEQLIALTSSAHMVVSVDTANVHIASALNIPTVAIMWPEIHPTVWAPLVDASKIITTTTSHTLNEFEDRALIQAIDELEAELATRRSGPTPRRQRKR